MQIVSFFFSNMVCVCHQQDYVCMVKYLKQNVILDKLNDEFSNTLTNVVFYSTHDRIFYVLICFIILHIKMDICAKYPGKLMSLPFYEVFLDLGFENAYTKAYDLI